MSSPFPGMDPYLEAPERWQDFHGDLAAEIRTALNRLIQPRYFARMTPYVTYEEIEVGRPRAALPDVTISQPQPPRAELGAGIAAIAPAPAASRVPLEMPLRLYRVEVRTTGVEELVTVIEILSPANKRRGHEAFRDYRRKRRNILRSSVHLMEIDLLRGGERPPLEEPVPVASYCIMLSRADRRPDVDVWPIQLTAPLPVLPVPLLEPDPDVSLDLNAAVASVYERGAYEAQIDYGQPPPPPPLSAEEAVWVDTLLRQEGARREHPQR